MDKISIELDFFNKKVAVISDIHSNAIALNEVKNELQNYNVDCVVILGDLLTYGCHPQEVISILKDLSQEMPAYFVKGNHDQYYFNSELGVPVFSYKMPGYIEESIVWTLNNFSGNLSKIFKWYESIKVGPLYLSHANPYDYGEWGYLNTEEECKNAAEVLRLNKYKIGIFGHTHRCKSIHVKNNEINEIKAQSFKYQSDNDDVLILNAGSVGQPRGNGASFLVFELTEEVLSYTLVEIDPDLEAHINAIKYSDLSDNTKNTLISFFGELR